MTPDVRIVLADLHDPQHCEALLDELDAFSRDPVGGGAPLPDDTRARLIDALLEFGGSEILLAFRGDASIGMAICFVTFSSFKARAVLNLHDLSVRSEERGRGIGRALLDAVEARARELGCCKLTLEVHQDNRRAIGVYEAFGFEGHHVAGGEARPTLFIEKPLG